MGCAAGSPAVTPSPGADAAPAKANPHSPGLVTVGLDDQLRLGATAPPWPYGESLGECHAPVVVLDVGKGMKGIKSSFFKIFPRGKFMAVADFCNDECMLGKCVVLIHGGGEHKNYIGDSEKQKLAEHLRSGGAIMTISAGGTFCGCNKGSLGLLPILAHDRQHWQRGTGSVVLQRTPYGERLLPKIAKVESQYFNCPALLPLAEEHLQAFGTTLPGLPILTYETEMNDCQSATSLLGLPAVQLGELGMGRFVVISPNLEVNAGEVNIQLFRSLASWASAGQLRPLVTGLGEVIDGPRFDETSMTGTDRDGGELYAFPSASGKLPALSAECIAAAGDEFTEFTLPGNCRLVILDLGKGDELPSIFAPLVPLEAQRVIVAPQELDATLQPGDVIFLHGGMANEHAERLGVRGRHRIRQHLAEGGSVMGVCAGAHWLSCRDLPLWGHALPLVPHDNQNWRRGIGPAEGVATPGVGATPAPEAPGRPSTTAKAAAPPPPPPRVPAVERSTTGREPVKRETKEESPVRGEPASSSRRRRRSRKEEEESPASRERKRSRRSRSGRSRSRRRRRELASPVRAPGVKAEETESEGGEARRERKSRPLVPRSPSRPPPRRESPRGDPGRREEGSWEGPIRAPRRDPPPGHGIHFGKNKGKKKEQKRAEFLQRQRQGGRRELGDIEVLKGSYWEAQIQAALRVKEVAIRGKELFLKCQVLGTQNEGLLRAASGREDRRMEAHLCPEECTGGPHQEGVLHVKRFRKLGAAREAWMSNLMAEEPQREAPGMGGDELAELREDMERRQEVQAEGDERNLGGKPPATPSEDKKKRGAKAAGRPEKNGRRRAARIAKRKGRESRGSSTTSSSSTEDQTTGDATLFGSSSKVLVISRRLPGALAAAALEEAAECLITQEGGLWELRDGPLPALFVRYYRAQLGSRMAPAMGREALTLCQAMDCLLRGRPAEALDLLGQRVKALELQAGGVHYTVAQQQELLPRDTTSISTTPELHEAARRAREEGRVRAEASRPYGVKTSTTPKGEDWTKGWPRKGQGKGKSQKGDTKKPNAEKAEKGKTKGG
eukprot:s689_g48.t1